MADPTPRPVAAASLGSEQAGSLPAGAHVSAARHLLVRAVQSAPDTEVLLPLLDALAILEPFGITHPCPPAPAAAPVGADAGLDRVLLFARAEVGRASPSIQPPSALASLRRASGYIAQADRMHGRTP
jgi:hypothetical protein